MRVRRVMATLSTVTCLGAIATSAMAGGEYSYNLAVDAPHAVIKLNGQPDSPEDLEEGKFKHTFTNTGDLTDTYRMVISYAEYHSSDEFAMGWTMCTTTACVVPGISDDITLEPAQSDTVTLKVVPFFTSGSSRVTLSFESLGSGEVTTLDYALVTDDTDVVIIDDDGGDEYEDYVATALENAGVTYGIYPAELESLADAGVDLDDTSYLILLTGDASSGTISPADEAVYASYLDGAGKMIFSGQDLLDDVSGSSFATTYMGAALAGSAAGELDVDADVGGPFGTPAFSFSIAGGAGNQVSQDALAGDAAYRYDGGDVAGVYVDGGYRTVTLGFGLEAMSTADIQELLTRAEAWFEGLLSADEAFDVVRPPAIRAVATPNPFRSSARLLLDVPDGHRDDVRVTLFDAAGRELRVLHDGPLATGVRELSIVPRDALGRVLANGVYHYRVTAGTAVTNGSLTLVR